MRIANPFIMIAHVIASLREEADVGWQRADTIKFDFKFRFPGTRHEVKVGDDDCRSAQAGDPMM